MEGRNGKRVSEHFCFSHIVLISVSPQVTEFCQQMKEHMYAVYEDNSCDMQAKLEELSEILERCSHLNDDLLGASQALKGLSQGLALSLTPEQ